MTYTYCCVYSTRLLMMDREKSETCRVLFQNKFEKLVHLVGFIIRTKSGSFNILKSQGPVQVCNWIDLFSCMLFFWRMCNCLVPSKCSSHLCVSLRFSNIQTTLSFSFDREHFLFSASPLLPLTVPCSNLNRAYQVLLNQMLKNVPVRHITLLHRECVVDVGHEQWWKANGKASCA